MPAKGKYTDPKLRDEVKEEVQQGDKGGAPGQWSARKAQFMASEYKKRGGDYTTDKETGQDESQKNLSKWSEEDWQTKEGSGNAKKEDGTEKRYLPKKAWENMTEEEKEETEEKKEEGSKEGKQHVQNTGKAKQARSKASKDEEKKGKQNDEDDDQSKDKKENAKPANGEKQDTKSAPRRGRSAKNNGDEKTDKSAAKKQDDTKDEDDAEDDEKATSKTDKKAGEKRGRQEKQDTSSKKQKSNNGSSEPKDTIGSKHDSAEEPAPAASADRLPKKGQRVSWKALPGWVHGEVTEIVTTNKQVDGKSVKASKGDPRIVLKSDNGKIAVHKPQAVHFADE